MRGGIVLLVIALVVIYLGVSGKFCCFTQFLSCAVNDSSTPCQCGTTTTADTALSIPPLPPLPKLPALASLG